MEQSNKSLKIAVGVAIVLMIGAITWGGWNARLNSGLEQERDQEKLRSEALLSEKLMVEKNLLAGEAQIKDLAAKNAKLAQQISDAENLAENREASIRQLQKQLAANKKMYAELQSGNKQMESQLAALNQQLAQLQGERLAANQEAEALRNQVDNLRKELALAHSAHYDQVLVETTRGKKDKLVSKATRTKKLRTTIMVPAELKDVQFQIFDPSGKLISSSPENGVLAVRINDAAPAMASTSASGSGKTYKQAEMTFLPKRKLKAGTYRVEVLSENLPVGSLQLRLR